MHRVHRAEGSSTTERCVKLVIFTLYDAIIYIGNNGWQYNQHHYCIVFYLSLTWRWVRPVSNSSVSCLQLFIMTNGHSVIRKDSSQLWPGDMPVGLN